VKLHHQAVVLCCVIVTSAAWSFELKGQVVYVDDGDTLILDTQDGLKTNIRLSDIDAPEVDHGPSRPGQIGGQESKRSLSELAATRYAVATCYEVDRYGRSVCTVRIGDIDVNAEQLKRGMAWANRSNPRYVRDERSFSREEAARLDHRGLWSAAQQIPPWIWRKECWEHGRCGSN
jgi:endonuclease YncB( thermonuclease family)